MNELERERARELGKEITYGALFTVAKYFFIGLAMVLLAALVADYFRWGFDGTDDRDRGKRSNMALRTDHGTGCQYLESTEGHLTPRLDATGKHYC